MDKINLTKEVSSTAGVSRMVTKKVIEAFCKVVSETVKNGEEVNIYGFGKLELKERAAKRVRNPRTGEMMQIPAAMTTKFRAGKKFEKMLLCMKTRNVTIKTIAQKIWRLFAISL